MRRCSSEALLARCSLHTSTGNSRSADLTSGGRRYRVQATPLWSCFTSCAQSSRGRCAILRSCRVSDARARPLKRDVRQATFNKPPSVKLLHVKFTLYFEAIRGRSDRAIIRDEWTERAVRAPIREEIQEDGRIRRWTVVQEMDNRYLRVILLPDGEAIHNAFFDRGFRP
jgi:hypothetical protein